MKVYGIEIKHEGKFVRGHITEKEVQWYEVALARFNAEQWWIWLTDDNYLPPF